MTENKEFEKWWREDYSKQKFWEPEPPSSIAECAWKAALKWIQRELQKAREGRDVRFDLGLYDMLKKELGESFVTKHTDFIMKVEEEINAKTQKEY